MKKMNDAIYHSLCEKASKGNLQANPIRKLCWPVMLRQEYDLSHVSKQKRSELKDQIRKDINRSLYKYQHLRPRLFELVYIVFTTFPSLHYYQGFHDIAANILLVLGPKESEQALISLSKYWLRDFMLSNLDATVSLS